MFGMVCYTDSGPGSYAEHVCTHHTMTQAMGVTPYQLITEQDFKKVTISIHSPVSHNIK